MDDAQACVSQEDRASPGDGCPVAKVGGSSLLVAKCFPLWQRHQGKGVRRSQGREWGLSRHSDHQRAREERVRAQTTQMDGLLRLGDVAVDKNWGCGRPAAYSQRCESAGNVAVETVITKTFETICNRAIAGVFIVIRMKSPSSRVLL